MKISIIKLCLEKYDEHKGPFRTYLKEEPHIKDLRDFYTARKGDGQDRSLSPEEHLKVVTIALGKKHLMNHKVAWRLQTYSNL
ncbi:hypothetical protein [Legionella tunisiensis]|uniref:hypothetical protein n=1 Tax=Legionella tunisiensis TaxID=1034944 RepID=UPI0002DA5021|nr:hypothetical protein [Legionella tunisiensis]